MVAEPAATALTSPLALTVAMAVLLLAQVATRPESGLPLASCGVAVSCAVWPTWTLAVAGFTATEATGGGFTVIAAVPLLPSLEAVIVAEPAATAGPRQLALNVGTAVVPLLRATGRP